MRLCFDENLRKIQNLETRALTITHLVLHLVLHYKKNSSGLNTHGFFDPISESSPACSRFSRKTTHKSIGDTPVHTAVRSEEVGQKMNFHCPEKLFCAIYRSTFWSNSLNSGSFETLEVAMSPQGTLRAQCAQN